MAVTTRFAPSPTGYLHIGGVRTALFSYLFARQNNGTFALRIEDTDTARNKQEWADALISDLTWLGLKHDTFAKQSERTEIYTKYIDILLKNGAAYISKETPKEPGQRDEVIRFKNPNKVVVINDLIRGEVKVDTTDLGDFVIARSITEPIFHLAVVVDDFEMGITHVIRAEEHLSNTPRQILIQEAIGATRPIYAHLPLVLAPDKSKLSKRKHGETVSLTYYRDKGYLPEAILNCVAMIGWNPGTDQELFTLDELVTNFRLDKVQKGGAVFNVEKLDWFNKEYIKKMTDAEFASHTSTKIPEWLSVNTPTFKKMAPLIREKIICFSDIPDMFTPNGELGFVKQLPNYKPELLLWKKNPDSNTARSHLTEIAKLVGELNERDWNAETIKNAVWAYTEANGRGDVLWPMRVALTGKEKSPDPFISASILGKSESLDRIDQAIKTL